MQVLQKHNCTYPEEDRPRLREILQQWKLEILFETLVGNTFYYLSHIILL